MGSKQEPSLTLTNDRPALESRRVRTQPRTVTVLPASMAPERACLTLDKVGLATAMGLKLLRARRIWTLSCSIRRAGARRVGANPHDNVGPRPSSPSGAMSISITPPARERIRQFLAQTPDAMGVRFGVKRTGCSG